VLGREYIVICLLSYHNGRACRNIRRLGLPKKDCLLYTGTGTVCCNGLTVGVDTLRQDKIPVLYHTKCSLVICHWSAIYSSTISNQCIMKTSG